VRENAPHASLFHAPRLIEPDRGGLSKSVLLRGQVAVVTGAGRGIGRTIAETLASSGAAVAVAARSREDIDRVAATIEADGGSAIAVPVDVSDLSAVSALMAETERRLGPPTLLVNNAAAAAAVGPLEEAQPDVWWNDVTVTLKGTFLCSRAVLPGMRTRGHGRIVNVSSYAATRPRPFATAYGCAKAGLLHLTESLAAELAGTGVLAFAIAPGFLRTALIDGMVSSDRGRRFLPELAEREDEVDPALAGRLVADIATGRLDPLAGRLLHVLDDVDELLERGAEIEADDLYALRLRRIHADT
jgi:NAD(P)-dependent dehydrogenase (short-subunit alcohol dehydrogenase family)